MAAPRKRRVFRQRSSELGIRIDVSNVAEALDVLAMAETGSDDQFGDVLQSAHPVTASGGLVLALVSVYFRLGGRARGLGAVAFCFALVGTLVAATPALEAFRAKRPRRI